MWKSLHRGNRQRKAHTTQASHHVGRHSTHHLHQQLKCNSRDREAIEIHLIRHRITRPRTSHQQLVDIYSSHLLHALLHPCPQQPLRSTPHPGDHLHVCNAVWYNHTARVVPLSEETLQGVFRRRL